jgi:hypothetical protein
VGQGALGRQTTRAGEPKRAVQFQEFVLVEIQTRRTGRGRAPLSAANGLLRQVKLGSGPIKVLADRWIS